MPLLWDRSGHAVKDTAAIAAMGQTRTELKPEPFRAEVIYIGSDDSR